MTNQIAVLLMAYGGPRDTADIEPYYTDIRRGRQPSAQALADLTARYDAIGGISPLTQRTEDQRRQIQSALDAIEPGRYLVTVGLKHAEPKIETAVEQLLEAGHDQIVGVVLAPHYSAYSVGQYLDRMNAASGRNVATTAITSWAREPALIEFVTNDLRHRLQMMGDHTKVLFTAHSLPERILADGDPYPHELRATAEAVADALGLREGIDWQIAWQSAGRTPEPWIGPDILAVIDSLGTTPTGSAVTGVIVSAVGFVSDHLEVLYDLDIEARERAATYGLRFDRTRCVNDDPAVMGALAQRIDEIATASFEA